MGSPALMCPTWNALGREEERKRADRKEDARQRNAGSNERMHEDTTRQSASGAVEQARQPHALGRPNAAAPPKKPATPSDSSASSENVSS